MSVPAQSILMVGSFGIVIDVECHLSNGLPTIIIVGLGNRAIDEAKERIRSAFASAGLKLPRKRITINLAPADLPKESAGLDLAMACAILQTNIEASIITKKDAFIGELGLDGSVRPVRGLIGKLVAGRRSGVNRFFIPEDNAEQASLVPGITVVAIKNISQLELFLTGKSTINLPATTNQPSDLPTILISDFPITLSDIAGQTRAKRALLIAAAGGHNILLNGPPGTGKSMLAKALPSLLPPLNHEELLEVTHLHSLTSPQYEQLVTERPFRAPHHSASRISIIGGGGNILPGEISLAHHGVLFLDELPEFDRWTIESLRQPLEERNISITRARQNAQYPANFILVATANPCPCGFYGTKETCNCPAHIIRNYRQKLSGPILDRIDLHITVEPVEHSTLLNNKRDALNDELARQTVIKARLRQTKRYGKNKLNADMTNRDLSVQSHLNAEAKQFLNKAAEKLHLSARSYMRVIKVARTIADLENSTTIDVMHVAEAIQYRPPRPEAIS